jgi:uncharacterized protein involved in exopolysaccharide biosynthesis
LHDNTFESSIKRSSRPSARKQVDVQANTAILTELVKQSELAKVTLRKETPLIQVIDRPILPKEGKVWEGEGILLEGLSGVLTVLGLIVRRVLRDISIFFFQSYLTGSSQ